MTDRTSLAIKLAGCALACVLFGAGAGAWEEPAKESRPLRRLLAARQNAAAANTAQQNNADATSPRGRAPTWRQDPRYQYRGVFENWNALPNDVYGRSNAYRVPPAEGFQKMYGPPENYPQNGPRPFGGLFTARANKQNHPAEGSASPQLPHWTPPVPEPRAPIDLPKPIDMPKQADLPIVPRPPVPAPLPLEPKAQPLPVPRAPTFATPATPAPAKETNTVAKPATPPMAKEPALKAAPVPPQRTSVGVPTFKEFDFPDPPPPQKR